MMQNPILLQQQFMQSLICPKHNDQIKGICFNNGKCEERLMCRTCRKLHDSNHLNYYEELEDLLTGNLIGELKFDLEEILRIIDSQNFTYRNNSELIVNQIDYLIREIQTHVLQRLTQTRDMLNDGINKKLQKNNSLKQELVSGINEMLQTYEKAINTKFTPQSTADDMVQAIGKAQLLREATSNDPELQSADNITLTISHLAIATSGQLFQQVKLSLEQICQDILNSFMLEGSTKQRSVSKGKLIQEQRPPLQENQSNIINPEATQRPPDNRKQQKESIYSRNLPPNAGPGGPGGSGRPRRDDSRDQMSRRNIGNKSPENNKGPYYEDKRVNEPQRKKSSPLRQKDSVSPQRQRSTPQKILQLFQKVDQEEARNASKPNPPGEPQKRQEVGNQSTISLSPGTKDFVQKVDKLAKFITRDKDVSNKRPDVEENTTDPRKMQIERRRNAILEYRDECITKHKQIIPSGLAYVEAKEELITAGIDGTVQILNMGTMESAYSFRGSNSDIVRILYIPEKDFLLIADVNGAINVCDYKYKCKVLHTFRGHTGAVYALDFLPDSNLVVSGGEDECIRIWNVTTGREIHAMKTTDTKIGAICRLGGAKKIAVGFDQGHINIIVVSQIKKVAYTIKAHNSYVLNLAAIDEQNLLLSSAEDGILKIWRILETRGDCVRRLLQEGSSIRSFVAFSEKDLVVTNYADSHVRVWKLSTGQRLDDYYDKSFGESMVGLFNRDEVATANLNEVKLWVINQ